MPWRKFALRGSTVLARVDAQGNLEAKDGRVEIRYKPQAKRAYHALAANLSPVDTQVMPDAHCELSTNTSTSKTRSAPKRPTETPNPPSAPQGNEVLVYADGACRGNPGPAGAGVVMLWDDEGKELSEYLGEGTNNIAELTAILRALESLPPGRRPVHIYTDSTYSIGMLTKGWKPRANQDLIASIRALLRKTPDVSFFYVRGHVGVPLNERADELATAAARAKRSQPWFPTKSV